MSTPVERGQIAFDAQCDTCHVGAAAGLGPASTTSHCRGGLIRFQVRDGLGAMPSFSEEQISDSELNAIVGHLQALRQHECPNTHLSIEAR